MIPPLQAFLSQILCNIIILKSNYKMKTRPTSNPASTKIVFKRFQHNKFHE